MILDSVIFAESTHPLAPSAREGESKKSLLLREGFRVGYFKFLDSRPFGLL